MGLAKKILVTGDKGYIGSVLTSELLERDYIVTGMDAGYFIDCALDTAEDDYESINRPKRFERRRYTRL